MQSLSFQISDSAADDPKTKNWEKNLKMRLPVKFVNLSDEIVLQFAIRVVMDESRELWFTGFKKGLFNAIVHLNLNIDRCRFLGSDEYSYTCNHLDEEEELNDKSFLFR